MRVIIVGAGEVGSSIAASLAETHDVVVIDVDPDLVESLTYSSDVLALAGDGTDVETLEEAGVGDADMVIASTDDDETNLVVTGTAKTVADPFTIARVRNTSFLRTWRRSTTAFGVDFMVCTNLLAAEAIVRVAGIPAARDVEAFADGRVQMAEFDIPTDSPLVGRTVREADTFEALTFAAVIDEDGVAIPRGDTPIEPGADVVVIGSPESVREFGEQVSAETDDVSDVVIIGGSPIGEETARLLEDRGRGCRLIEADKDRAKALAEDLSETLVMQHDATDVEFLLREHVDKADLGVVTLDSDERTLLVALLARQIGTKRTVAVVESAEYVDLFEAVGIDVAINPREVTAEEITRFTHTQHTENVALIGDRAEVVEIEVGADSALVGRPIREAVPDLPEGVVIGAITRADEFIRPRGDTVIQRDDHVVLLVETDVLDRVLEAV